MPRHEKISRIACAALSAAIAFALASAFADASSAWYMSLQKPQLQPPQLIFIITFAILYLLFAASLALVSQNPLAPKKTYFLFALTGALNALWTYAFFFRQRAAGAVFVLLLILIAAASLFLSVYGVHKTAAYLLIPYLVLAGFALYLNYETAFMN